MVEVVGKSVGAGANSFFYKQQLIGACRDALAEDIVVGLILVHIAQAGSEDIGQGIPPLEYLHDREQEQIPGVEGADMAGFVQEDFASVLSFKFLPRIFYFFILCVFCDTLS